MELSTLKNNFYNLYRAELMESKKQVAVKTYFSPGRVNLIGEHIDYSGGMVLPCAINLGTYAVVSRRTDQTVKIMSLNFEEMGILSFELDQIENKPEMDWANYPMGVFNEFIKRGHVIDQGFNILFYGDLPNGAGLSSSASIEVLTATIINDYLSFGFTKTELALLCQKSENEFNGMNCGIMDQFSVAHGVKDHAIFLNCDTLEYELIPAALKDYRLMIINTNKKRGLVDSEYNMRRRECEVALEIIQKGFDQRTIQYLCDLTPVEFLDVAPLLNEDTVYKRAYHSVVENFRVHESKKALSNGNLIAFGEWMYSSHESLKNYFQVSCKELDIIVDLSRNMRGVLGARMTGAGFGGCAIALVEKDKCDYYMEKVGRSYNVKTGLKATFYIAEIADGAGVVHESF
ncbi:galactokinase [Fusibacter ferrireducens]|uniref:Galactokinase n=1 Tax=Fusibacter ferrireducens TaxID=2785058 RepID=A0ABR9ZVX5_9FIRM|nr:galactokinase [Fusibacter ferrireducens]MBF4694615.1 galactokinase [Fusibacter ferrireducens]